MKFFVGDKSKYRNPSVTLGYGKEYNIELYKLTNYDLPSLDSLITIIHHSFKMNMKAGYYSSFANNPPLTVEYQIGKPEPLKHIYLSLAGKGYQVILRSDSIASFYSNMQLSYLKFSPKSMEEIVIRPNGDIVKEVAVETTLYQTKTGLYLIVLNPQKLGGQIPPGYTLKLIKGLAVASL
ncbi:hypothetical protein NAF17_09825 [Mucilaginibacter sp. RB4R14]|uniref:hypothetical protein n=1 Tax=Mucilaginibacter aurantiaciroseus TaxID=2949308 RepID=UPI002090A137|nr:hypothetical protein [Mucilaginibacter aurantiaciroseus]MCO5935841.1 hypothetical protein [Mucilaginibacter aurantiaciroseus]